MSNVEQFQRRLLNESRALFSGNPIPEPLERAFMETPRHRFVKRYRLPSCQEWCEVSEQNLDVHLSTLYANRPLNLLGDDDANVRATISQPSLVLYMLHMLRLEKGHRVFELGAGSGWNAALMGRLVGPEGRVHSLEIIPEVARDAARHVESLGIRNVSVLEADGGGGHEAGGPYDRVMFTAGSYDLPRPFYAQVKEGGLLLMLIKNKGGGDSLFLLKKIGDRFESLDALDCSFVPMTGRYQVTDMNAIRLEDRPEWPSLKASEIFRVPFWWGGKGAGRYWRTMGIRSFLGITETLFETFAPEKKEEEEFFGLWDRERASLVLARDEVLIAYGNPEAYERLRARLRQWIDLGMPGAANFNLKVYPADARVVAERNHWIVKRKESQFLWSLSL